ncbi:MAG: hypothetical protein GX279_05565 [Clostridiaceae bacterium]|nr:hypothetical protein [Clostridiaceae bacterium]
MFRNSRLYRRWWYMKKRNIKRIRMLLRFAITILIICIVYLFSQISIAELLGL